MTEERHTGLDAWKKISLISLAVIVISFPLYLLVRQLPSTYEPQGLYEAEYTGGASCRECHQKEYDLWQGSDHDLAMAHATDESVLGDFNDAEFRREDEVHRFYRKEGRFFVWTTGPDGKMGEFEVTHTFGYRPLQQYLVPFEGGRLQTLPLTWDCNKGEWYHMADTVYSREDVHHGNWFYWTNQAQNWNGMCADCHSTQLRKNYDIETDSYQTTWKDINVHCEACHGPGSAHIKWAKLPEMGRLADESCGLMVNTRNLNSREYVDRCARCHARRTVFSDFPGYYADLLDYMIPTLLVEPHYFPDGQILDEDYVYASFTHSKMFLTDIKCNDCHDAHSLKLKYEAVSANDLCLQCHRSDIYDRYEHHFHKAFGDDGEALRSGDAVHEVGSGSLCINCHMTGRYYMGVDFRRDHSFRIPRPDLSLETGSPNACIGCHAGESDRWAADWVNTWYGLSRRPHFGTIFSAARKGENTSVPELVRIAMDDLFPVIVRATALYELDRFQDSLARDAVIRSLSDPEALIRQQAVQSYHPSSLEEMIDLLGSLLNDPVRAVRQQAAFRLSSIPAEYMDSTLLREYSESIEEYRMAMEYTGDFAPSRHNLGVVYQNRGNYSEAEKHFIAAISIDDEFYPSMANLAIAYNQQGKNDEAEALIRKMIREFPEQGDAHYSLGLLLAEKGDYTAALASLETALVLLPDYARIRYNIALLHQHFGNDEMFVKFMEEALLLEPQNMDFLYPLAQHYYRNGNSGKLREVAETILNYYPDSPLGPQLLELAGDN